MRVRVEQLLIRKRGVISVVFEIGAELAVLYTRAPPEELASFVATMTGSAVAVLPPEPEEQSEDEEEELIKVAQLDPAPGKENGAPGYLDHTGQRIRDVAKKDKKEKTHHHAGRVVAQRETPRAARGGIAQKGPREPPLGQHWPRV